MGLHQTQHSGGHGGDDVALYGKGVGYRLGNGHYHQQHQGWRLGIENRSGQQAAEDGTHHPAVTPFQSLCKATAQHHDDGDQDPVTVGGPGQGERAQVTYTNRQRGADCMTQRRRVPAPEYCQWAQRPAGRADEQLPGGTHRSQVGLDLVPRQTVDPQNLIVDIAHPVGQPAQQRDQRRAVS